MSTVSTRHSSVTIFSKLDKALIAFAIEGVDGEHHSQKESAWYGMLDGLESVPRCVLSPDEIQLLNKTAGVIVRESYDGKFSVEYYNFQEDLYDAWEEILKT